MSSDKPSIDCPHCGHKHTRIEYFGINTGMADGREHHRDDNCDACHKKFHTQFSVDVHIQTFTEMPKSLRDVIERQDAQLAGASSPVPPTQ